MCVDSSSGLTNIINNSPFDAGVAYISYSEEAGRYGVVIGGASLWMTKGKEENVQQAAWDFMKFLQTPEIQVRWHVEISYFAIHPSIYEVQTIVDEWEQYPQLKVVVNQLQDTKPSAVTQSALISVFPESRQLIVQALENFYIKA